MTFLDEAFAMQDEIIAFRRDFHRHPELGMQEVRTSSIVAQRLRELGLSVTTGVATTGVVGLLRGQAESPVVLLRFDMDALPIKEDTGVDYASENPGIMHACGHDSHMAVGLSVAKLLAAKRDEIPGTVKFVFQPAEEGGGGAREMVAAGVLEDPKPDFALGMHVWNEKPVGWYGLKPGPIMAGAAQFTVTLTGKGGHAASPQNTADPVVALAQIITALQTITSRNVSPLESAVVSVSTVNAGSAFNIIPQKVEFSGTIRTFKPEVEKTVTDRFTTIIHTIATAMGCTAEITTEKFTHAVINDPALTAMMATVTQAVNPNAQIDKTYQTMGSEDFSFLIQEIPGCFIFVGSANAAKGLDYGHHHPKFNIDEACLPYAAAILAEGALAALKTRLHA